MKRGVFIFIVLFSIIFVSACKPINDNFIYPRIIHEDFINELINENTVLRQNVSDLKLKLDNQQREIEALNERLERFYEIPTARGSSYDWIRGERISVLKDKVVIELDNATLSRVSDTHSMDPLIHKYSKVIGVPPISPESIHVGDIAAYQSDYTNGIILHRIIAIGEDEYGWFAVFKGDNNPLPDPGKVRFNKILRVVVGIIY